MGNQNKEKYNQDTIHFDTAICRVLHKRSNIVVSFLKHIKLQNINYFRTCSLGRSRQMKMKTLVSKTLNILKLLYTRCSEKDVITLLLSRSTWNFKKTDFYTPSLSKCKIKRNRIRTTYNLKLLYSTAPFAEHLKFQK